VPWDLRASDDRRDPELAGAPTDVGSGHGGKQPSRQPAQWLIDARRHDQGVKTTGIGQSSAASAVGNPVMLWP
jgi:hypothetical protein